MEIAKIVKSLGDTQLLPQSELDALLARLVPEQHRDGIWSAVAGLSEEDEFALICRSLGTCTSLVRFDQKPLIESREIASDFVARFRPGLPDLGISRELFSEFRCLIEVKSTDEIEFVIRGGDLRRRREFARSFGLPLLFAVRFKKFGMNSVWAIVDASADADGPLRIGAPDIGNGLRTLLWEDIMFVLLPGTGVTRVFDTAGPPGPRHPDFGPIVDLRIGRPDGTVFAAERLAPMYDVILHAFGFELRNVKTSGSRREESYSPRLDMPNATWPDLIMAVHRGLGIEPGQILSEVGTSRVVRLDRELILHFLRPLEESGTILRFGLGEPATIQTLWRRYGGDAAALEAAIARRSAREKR